MSKIKRFVKSNPILFHLLKKGLLYGRYVMSLFEKDKYSNLPNYADLECFEIKDNKYHCYFGYYDKSPVNMNGEYVAFLKIKEGSCPGDLANICIYNIENGDIKSIGQTRTWNWQQGCMLQWINSDTLAFNYFDSEEGEYMTRIENIKERSALKSIKRAAYSFNRDFSKYLSLNFYRLDLYAKGYGYPYNVDKMEYSSDGIWEVDVEKEESKLIIDLNSIIQYEAKEYMDCQHYVNHVAYTPDEKSIIFIHRWQLNGGEFKSRLLRFDLLSNKLDTLLDNGHVSHYCWKDNDKLLIYATDSNSVKSYIILDINNKSTKRVEGLPDEDGHPSYSNDKKMILTDTYPNNKRVQHIFIYDVQQKQLKIVDKLYSPLKYFNDERCDLHPRWSVDNNYICVDTTSSGYRGIKIYKIA